MKILSLGLALLLLACGSPLPEPPPITDVCGNGTYCVLNPDVTQDTINQTICVSGWTATIRPPYSYTEPIKLKLIAQGQNVAVGDTNPADYELDHRLSLELGGNAYALGNLSIEYPHSINPKDLDENYYKHQVCSGAMTLVQAQTALINKWLGPYPEYKNG